MLRTSPPESFWSAVARRDKPHSLSSFPHACFRARQGSDDRTISFLSTVVFKSFSLHYSRGWAGGERNGDRRWRSRGPYSSTFLGAHVWLGARHSIVARELPAGPARRQKDHGHGVHPLPRHFPRRGGSVRRRCTGQSRSQLFLCRSDLRRPAGERSASFRRAKLHAQEVGLEQGCAACVLVQAERFSSQGLRQMGRDDLPVRQAPRRALRNRGSLAVVFRSVE